MYCIDIETVDPDLTTKGPSYVRGEGHVRVVGVADEDGRAMCFNVKDERLHRILATPDTKIGHNIAYDLDWLVNGCGLTVNGRFEDTMTREALLDEYSTKLDLDSCCQRYGLPGKSGSLDDWWHSHGGKGDSRKYIDCIPVPEVVKYCEQDVRCTMELYKKQQIRIAQQGLQQINDLESDIIPILLLLRKNGLRVSRDALDAAIAANDRKIGNVLQTLLQYGITEDIAASGKKLAAAFIKLGIKSPIGTDKGNDSFAAFALQMIDHPAAAGILKLRGLVTKRNTFFKGTFGEHLVGDRIYSTFKPTKRDLKEGGGGAVTGRFSSANPNVQNIPAKDDEESGKTGTEIRSLILPEDGMCMLSFDYKQIEYAVLAHYATGEGADFCREQISKGVDYHSIVQEMSGMADRKTVKNLNFGSVYGMGVHGMITSKNADFVRSMRKAADSKNMRFEEYCQYIYDEYHSKLPYVKATAKKIADTARQRPVRSVLGRSHRLKVLPGLNQWGKPNDNAHKMPNHLIQGSAADIMKAGLVKAHKAGIFNTLILHTTVHDENVCSAPYSKEGLEACEALAEAMTTCVKLKVPIRVDKDMGVDWGHCNSEGYEAYKKRCTEIPIW